MIFFWDRNIPKSIPEAVRSLHPPFENELHSEHFPQFEQSPENGDDTWLSVLGDNGWFLLTRDHQIHRKPNEAAAIRQHKIGCFYIWGRNAKTWDIARCLIRALPAILKAAETTERPFIYRVDQFGRLERVPLPLP